MILNSAPAQQRAAVRQCAAVCSSARGCVQQYAWQRVTVCRGAHGSVCTQCARQCAAVRLVVYDSAQQGVCGSAAVRLIRCMTVRQCVWRCGCVRQSGSVWQCAWQCVTVRAAECGSAHGRMQCMRQCASVRLVVYGSASDSVRLSSSAAV